MGTREFVVVVTGADGKSSEHVADMLRFCAQALAEHIVTPTSKFVPGAEISYLDDVSIDIETGEVTVRM